MTQNTPCLLFFDLNYCCPDCFEKLSLPMNFLFTTSRLKIMIFPFFLQCSSYKNGSDREKVVSEEDCSRKWLSIPPFCFLHFDRWSTSECFEDGAGQSATSGFIRPQRPTGVRLFAGWWFSLRSQVVPRRRRVLSLRARRRTARYRLRPQWNWSRRK